MASYVPGAPVPQRPPSRASLILQAISRAYFARERARLGIGAEQRADQEAATQDMLRKAQMARLLQQMELEPGESDLKRRLTEAQIRNYDEPNRGPTSPGSPHYEKDAQGNVTAVVPQPDGSFKTVPVGPVGTPQREPREPQPPGRLSPLVDAKGNVVATFHNVTGAVTPIQSAPAPGAPAAVGDTAVRRSPQPAQERKDQAGLELALEGTQELRRLLALPEVKNTIGYASGRLAALKRGTIGATPEIHELFRTSDRLAEFLLRALSGAQINESEYGRLRSLIPNPRTHISQFETDLNLFEAELKSTIEKRFAATDAQPADPAAQTRVINGVTYVKVPGGWKRQ